MLLGLHHITAYAGDARRNLDFYTRVLGLKLVKRTVNFDDPSTWHFYFGDQTGTPGTLLTFFPWPTAPAGRAGSGRATSLAITIPQKKIDSHQSRFGETFFTLIDPAGLEIELFPGPSLRVHSTTLTLADPDRSAKFLIDILGARFVAEENDRRRFDLGGSYLDIVPAPGLPRAKPTSGTIHHLAFRVADVASQNEWRDKLIAAQVRVTRVIDRQYFRSIYFREPGGVLFEIATDGPGFLIDEPAGELGRSLKLPPWLEPVRESIERRLTPLDPEPK